jgi:hypothetical protein
MERFQTANFLIPENSKLILGFVAGINYRFKPQILRYKKLDIN